MQRTSLQLVVVVAGTAALLVAASLWLTPDRADPLSLEPPEVALTGVEDTVQAVIRAAVDSLRTAPESPRAWGELAMVYDAHGFRAEAIESYERAAALDPRNVQWVYFGAIAKDELGQEDARSWYARAAELRPKYVPLLLRYAGYELEHGDRETAAELYGRALLERPTIPYAHYGLARVALEDGDLERAETYAVRGLEIDVFHSGLHGLLAEIRRRAGDDSTAALERLIADQVPPRGGVPDELYAEVGRRGVGSHWAMQRGNGYFLQARFADAERELGYAASFRADPQIYTSLGVALQRQGRFSEAISWHERAIELSPDFAEAHTNLGAVLLELNRSREAVPHLDQARALEPASPNADMVTANYHVSRRQWGPAISAMQAALERSPDNVRILQALADLLQTVPSLAHVDTREALRLAERASELLGGRDPGLLVRLAEAKLLGMDTEGAKEYALRARRLARISGRSDLLDRISQLLTRLRVS